MEQFVGREKELRMLDETFGRPSTVLIYGRRRIGKTTLIKQFCRDKRALYLCAVDGTLAANLEYFSDSISDFMKKPVEPYSSIHQLLKDVGAICREEKTVIVIDEFQNLVGLRKASVSSHVQMFVDHVLSETDSMLILCGSSVRMMKSEWQDARKPLFGRFSRIIHLEPLSLTECKTMHPNMSDEDNLRLYLTVGGIPRYHFEMSQDTFRDCIVRNFFEERWMPEESTNLLDAEFPPSVRAKGVLQAIASGRQSLTEIARFIDLDPAACLRECIEPLERSDIIGVVNPMLGAPKRKKYYIIDNLMAFSFGVIEKRSLRLGFGDPGESFDDLQRMMDTFLGARFEWFCMDYLTRHYHINEIGKWWLDNEKGNIHIDIDVVAKAVSGRNLIDIFAECRFSEDPVGFRVLNTLDARTQRFKDADGRLMLFSASGFEPELEGFARGTSAILIGPDELYGRMDPAPLRERGGP